MNRTELIELAEKHGYGAEAAKILAGMSPKMVRVLGAHASYVDAHDGNGVFMIEPQPTRNALLRRGLTDRTRLGKNPPYKVSEMGYRVIGLYNLSKQA